MNNVPLKTNHGDVFWWFVDDCTIDTIRTWVYCEPFLIWTRKTQSGWLGQSSHSDFFARLNLGMMSQKSWFPQLTRIRHEPWLGAWLLNHSRIQHIHKLTNYARRSGQIQTFCPKVQHWEQQFVPWLWSRVKTTATAGVRVCPRNGGYSNEISSQTLVAAGIHVNPLSFARISGSR